MNNVEKEMIKTMASLMRKLSLNPKEQICLDELTNRMIEVNVKKAKKEVFDNIEKFVTKEKGFQNIYIFKQINLDAMKKRHLSTLQKSKAT